MRSAKDSQKLEKQHRESRWDGEKIIKGVTDPLHHLIETAHTHLSSFTHSPTSPTSVTPSSTNPPISSTRMSSQLQDVATVATPVARQDIVFHVTEDFKISYWSSKTQDETEDEQYNSDNLKVEGNAIYVNKELPILAAVAYKNGSGEDVVRVFFVDQSEFALREVRRVGPAGSKWSHGQVLRSKEYDIASKSGLTANVVETNNQVQLKVFYQKRTNKLSVAYSVLAVDKAWTIKDDWSNRADVTN
ncbi:hypothetical protein FPHYL_12959 [Fusarium phyllophilum]|uniref:Fucose-specific lectin n=1 Tax=Fusarium phyllophilum TaxID=47803 RepID=A0A8H5MQ74_9HYPO|nr:hypothetical protein FPHYL_12959 [Fusarium phyllophilum]